MQTPPPTPMVSPPFRGARRVAFSTRAARIVICATLLGTLATGCAVGQFGEPAIRTELYCGFSTPRAAVTEREFRQFLDEVVTPRFPQGYTVEVAEGRWRSDAGAPAAGREKNASPTDTSPTATEPSRVIIIVHPPTDDASRKIELIRREYKFRFDQESVLRVDIPVKASF